jgi:2-oxoglutarate dehydrogenase E1 component
VRFHLVEYAVDSDRTETPDVALPAETMFEAMLEAQSPVPVAGSGRPAAADAQSAAAKPLPAEAVALQGPALRLAQNMNASLALPVATSFRDIPVSILDARRRQANAAFKAAGRDQKLSFTHLIAWALVQATREFPMMGTAVVERDGVIYKVPAEHVNLGLAVDIERKDGSRGLVVPVLRHADTLDFAAFLDAYETVVSKARANRLMPDDFAGATMTLTNPGGLGTVASVPRLMPGQGSIIATGSIAYPPEFASTDPAVLAQFGVGKVMTMTSTYDHRVVQGAESGSFLGLVDQLLQGESGFYQQVFSALGLNEPAPVAPAPAALPPAAAAPAAAPSAAALAHVAAAMSLVRSIRTFGHLGAHLDPLGTPPPGDPAMDPVSLGLTPEIMATIPAAVLRVGVAGNTLAEVLPNLLATYCGTIAYEVEHLASHERRVWLRQQIESGAHRVPLSADEAKALLGRLTQVEGMEKFLHNAYFGAKRFSIEGVDMLVPMLDEVIELAAAASVRSVVLGMAHRGRLNVLAHIVGRPYESILSEFEGHKGSATPEGGTGDVKYHLGAEGSFRTRAGADIAVSLQSNPSHLEYVDPVIVGRVRAEQTDRRAREFRLDLLASLPVTIHGDAAFPGQGVVAETLNLCGLPGYTTGGTVHLIANNQVGFTTDPADGRSTRYSSDLAKGFDIPIIHVNADDPEACLSAVRLAMAYRMKFHADVLIDLVGYRRHGHNEADEPAYTQPVMYATVRELPTARQRYAAALEQTGVIAAGEADGMVEENYNRLVEIQNRFKASHQDAEPAPAASPPLEEGGFDTGVAAEMLTALNDELLAWPADFSAHPKLARQLERRRAGLSAEHGIDWGHGEALAFSSLLAEGTPIRITGQDAGRGTFSHRNAVLHDVNTGREYIPLQAMRSGTALFEIRNSPLSECAPIGFEYGYALAAPDALVIWEAQYGDFVNGAQVMLDQFVTSGLSKWGVSSRLTLLLPHGYEGGGPEHSSGRLERFLQAAAEDNIRVVNCTTPAQYFHLLRRQARWSMQRPLVVMTPKSLLRLPAAGSSLTDFTSGHFRTVLDDPAGNGNRASARSLLLCSGKIYYDLLAEAHKRGDERPPIARVEQLYPFPEAQLRELFTRYPSLTEVVWVQEEPRNMGAWTFMEERLSPILPPGVYLKYTGRPEHAAPSEGYAATHADEQARIVNEALAAGTSMVRANR